MHLIDCNGPSLAAVTLFDATKSPVNVTTVTPNKLVRKKIV